MCNHKILKRSRISALAHDLLHGLCHWHCELCAVLLIRGQKHTVWLPGDFPEGLHSAPAAE